MSGTGNDNPWNPLAWVVGDPDIGEDTWIGPFCLVDGSGGLRIGRGCDLAAGVQIYTHSSMRRCVTAGIKNTVDRAPVSIGDHTFLGAGVIVLMGVTIGSHCVVGAGSVVTVDLPDHTWAVGSPARAKGTVDPANGDLTPFS